MLITDYQDVTIYATSSGGVWSDTETGHWAVGQRDGVLECAGLSPTGLAIYDLLERAVPSRAGEQPANLVVDVLVAMGYGGSRKDAGRVIGKSGDEGIDGLINEDRLGLDVVYVQAKRWSRTVGRPDIQAFAGSLEGKRARKGVFITTSDFSREATEYVQHIEKKIVLVDGGTLALLMIDHGVGASEVASHSLKRIDFDFFGEDVADDEGFGADEVEECGFCSRLFPSTSLQAVGAGGQDNPMACRRCMREMDEEALAAKS